MHFDRDGLAWREDLPPIRVQQVLQTDFRQAEEVKAIGCSVSHTDSVLKYCRKAEQFIIQDGGNVDAFRQYCLRYRTAVQ
jgi:hypothetical protein